MSRFMSNINLDNHYFWKILCRRKYWLAGWVCFNIALTCLILRTPLFPKFYESSVVLYIERSNINPQIFFDTPDLKTYVVMKHGLLIPSKREQFTTLTLNFDRGFISYYNVMKLLYTMSLLKEHMILPARLWILFPIRCTNFQKI